MLNPCLHHPHGHASTQNDRKISSAEWKDHAAVRELAEICSLCNNSSVDCGEDGKFVKIGEATETALVVLVEKLNIDNLKVDGLPDTERALYCNKAIRSRWAKGKGKVRRVCVRDGH